MACGKVLFKEFSTSPERIASNILSERLRRDIYLTDRPPGLRIRPRSPMCRSITAAPRARSPAATPRRYSPDLIPQPRRHRQRYHGVFAPNHPLRSAVTALAIGNVGKRRDSTTGGHATGRHATEGCCDANKKPRSHDTSRIAWAKLMARVGEEFPFACPACGGDIRLRGDGRQEPAHFEPEVRKREKARMASTA